MKKLSRRQEMAIVSLICICASYTAAQAQQVSPDEAKLPAFVKAKLVKEEPNDDELQKLLKARYNAAVEELQIVRSFFLKGQMTFDRFFDPAQRLLHAGLELCDKPNDKITLLTEYVGLLTEYERIAEERIGARVASSDLFQKARYQRLDAEIQLLRIKRSAKQQGG